MDNDDIDQDDVYDNDVDDNGVYDDDDIFHATQTKTQFVDSVLFDKNC